MCQGVKDNFASHCNSKCSEARPEVSALNCKVGRSVWMDFINSWLLTLDGLTSRTAAPVLTFAPICSHSELTGLHQSTEAFRCGSLSWCSSRIESTNPRNVALGRSREAEVFWRRAWEKVGHQNWSCICLFLLGIVACCKTNVCDLEQHSGITYLCRLFGRWFLLACLLALPCCADLVRKEHSGFWISTALFRIWRLAGWHADRGGRGIVSPLCRVKSK